MNLSNQLFVIFFSLSKQQAVQEKFRQAGENLDNLNAWLDQVEREIASQESISEDPETLKSQINSIKVINLPWR